MTLTLAGPKYTVTACPTCKGKGRVPCPETLTSNGLKSASSGAPMPCPECQGKKVVPVPDVTP